MNGVGLNGGSCADETGPDAATTQRSAKLAPGGAKRVMATTQNRSVLGWQVLILIAIVAGMQLLNVTAGNLVMPSPVDVVRQSITMWSDGTMLYALGQSFTVLGLGFVLATVTGIAAGILLGGFP